MNPEPFFTVPSPHIAAAREALARLEGHLGREVGPLDASTDFGTLLFASLTLEAADPPYPPLELVDVSSPDPQADLRSAMDALVAAGRDADTAQEKLRLAEVVDILRELTDSPHMAASSAGPGERS